MGEVTKIQWCDATFNPWRGCTKVSPGCLNCYAEARDKRFTGGVHWGAGKPRELAGKTTWREPERWNEYCKVIGNRKRVFCASLADWLDDEVPIEWLASLFRLIDRTPHLDWLLLTKRPQLWKLRIEAVSNYEIKSTMEPGSIMCSLAGFWSIGQAPKNVWIGVSVEDQTRANERIPLLRQIPAKVRFLSVEPLLGPVDLASAQTIGFEANEGEVRHASEGWIDWVIIGGESGTHARPMNAAWALSLLKWCKLNSLPVFMKQMGCRPFTFFAPWHIKYCTEQNMVAPLCIQYYWLLKDHKGGDMAEWPIEYQVREFPK